MGPSNGSPASETAMPAALMAGMSYEFAMSALSTVTTTWTSSRKPSRNVGRSGRSVRRAVRMAVSDGRPSRRKNPPGILPAAYIRSSTSMVRGKKSMPSRGLAVVQAASTWVSPSVTVQAPLACRASLPDSKVISDPPMVLLSLIVFMGMSSWTAAAFERAPRWGGGGGEGRSFRLGQFSVVGLGSSLRVVAGTGGPQLITDRELAVARSVGSCCGSWVGSRSFSRGRRPQGPPPWVRATAGAPGARSARGSVRRPRAGGSPAGDGGGRPSGAAHDGCGGPWCGS